MMNEKSFMRLEEVAATLDVSKSYAYKIVQKLNAERSAVNQINIVGESEIFLKIVDDAHAKALVAQNDIANAQYRIFRRE